MRLNAFDPKTKNDLFISIDAREKTIPLSAYQTFANLRRAHLKVGDIAINSRVSNLVAIENKTLYDLLCSYSTNRLQNQLHALQDSDYTYCFLFVCLEKSRKVAGRTIYSPVVEQKALKYLHQVPSLFPKVGVEVFEKESEIILCVEELFRYILKHV